MLFRLAIRNLVSSLPSRLPQAVMVALTLALLFIGNSLLESSKNGLGVTYRQAFTGDASVSARADDTFTLFGSDLPLIGEYVVIPPLPEESLWRPVLSRFEGRVDVLPQVSASGILLLPNKKKVAVPLFGINAQEYFRFFPSLTLEEGTVTPADPRALWVNRTEWRVLSQAWGQDLVVGDSLDLGMTVRGNFLIRTVHLAGIYQNPGSDFALDRTLLVDPETARALNGYTTATTVTTTIAPLTKDLLDTDVNSLFDETHDREAPSSGGTDLAATERQLADTAGRDAMNRTLEGSWNFLLLKAKQDGDQNWTNDLQQALDQAGFRVQVRDWVGTAGGNALVVSLLQVFFSVGLGLVALVSALIVMNSLALSVFERTKEIGTWRALGASRGKVAAVIALETSLLVVLSALAGLVVAATLLFGLAAQGIPLDNPLIVSLLGTDQLRPSFSETLWVGHVALALVLAAVACWLPVTRALAITPLNAMQAEAAS